MPIKTIIILLQQKLGFITSSKGLLRFLSGKQISNSISSFDSHVIKWRLHCQSEIMFSKEENLIAMGHGCGSHPWYF
uniref:Uncharacterized protein n=1 Tax=Rhizophora mucronata TaxID=61149 RepID=A0A2P2LUL8_RHIMU